MIVSTRTAPTSSSTSTSTSTSSSTRTPTTSAPAARATESSAPVRQRASASTQAASRQRAAGKPVEKTSYERAPTVEEVRAGHNMEIGMRGPSVKKVQHMLNVMKGGAQLPENGIFDEATEKRVRQFQERHGIDVSGKVGSITYPALEKASAAMLSRASEAEKYDAYKARIVAGGGTFKSGPGERNILGIRTRTDPADSYYGEYDDKFVMLWKDANGVKHCKEYAGNTEPNGRWRTSGGRQLDGDAALEEGRLRPGYYEYNFSSSTLDVPNNHQVLRPVRDALVDRDMNNDGRFNDHRTSYGAIAMLFHSGFDGNTASAGCQTLAPSQWKRFWNDLQGARGTIGYTLVNG